MKMNYTGIIDTMFKLFALLLLGYYLNKKNYFNTDTNTRLSDFVVKFTAPALIISSVCGEQPANKGDVLKVVGIGIIFYLLLPIFAFIFTKLLRVEKTKEGVYQVLFIFSNVTFMCYPIVQSLYGDTAIFYNTLFHMPFNILIFTYGEFLLSKGEGNLKIRAKDVFTPGVIAAILAIIIYFMELKVPSFISTTCSFLGGVTTPLSMLILGSVLAGYSLKDLLTEKKIYVVAIIKLVVIPVIVFFVCSMIFTDPIIIGVATLSMAMPAASMCVMLSVKYEGQIKTASIGVFLTTILSLITIPAIYLLLLN
jgi:predicted permease